MDHRRAEVVAITGSSGLITPRCARRASLTVLRRLYSREARTAVKGSLNEIDHVRKVVARKTTMKVTRVEKPEGGQGEG